MLRSLPGSNPFPDKLLERLESALAAQSGKRPRTRHVAEDGSPRFSNRLTLESSPYLLQHAHNPVSWYPWGDEAFAEATRLARPVFLSIGYSTCHWCHVMEEESFEDETIAAFLNTHYIAIKVDREERPDIDAVYMRAAQQLSGSGGWPLSVWLTPDREPFFAGTYFPPYGGMRGAGPGFLDILTEIARLSSDDGPRIREAAQALTSAVRQDMASPVTLGTPSAASAPMGPDLALVTAAVDACAHAFDDQHGGLRLPQKFPSHVPIRLLLRHHQRTGDAHALHMAIRTLEGMAAGGIYDHIAGGFHRYATDTQWRVPHFEKMLYDNALLIVAYAEAWQITKRPEFERVVRETCDELLATFASPEGGFFSATDADSEGEEGKFFVWDEKEIRAVLGPGEETELFLRHYGVTAAGNFDLGAILYQPQPDEAATQRLTAARAKLAAVRKSRVPPLRDDKILASWNGLAMSAFVTAGRVLGEKRYTEAARRIADFLVGPMRDPEKGRLARSFSGGRLGVPGFLDDHAFVAAGMLDLFESTRDARWFDEAYRLCEETETLFGDKDAGGWYLTSDAHEKLLIRQRPTFDGAEPAGTSIALMNAARLSALTDDPRWRVVTNRALAFYLPMLAERPMAMTEMLLAVDFLAGPVHEIVLALPTANPTSAQPFEKILRETFCPRKILLSGDPTLPAWQRLEERIPLLRDKPLREGQATAYVCSQGHCELPTSNPEQFAQQISE